MGQAQHGSFFSFTDGVVPEMMNERMIDMCRKETERELCPVSRIGNGEVNYVAS